ncbi:MAG TPA: universal stress protein [Ktedonobacterales bacterium]
MFDRIIVPLDGSRFAEAALDPARELASLFHSRILLTRAIKPFDAPIMAFGSEVTEIELERLGEADAYLNEMAERLRAQGYDADFSLFIAEPGASISKMAELRHADLIVMNTRLRWKIDSTSRHPSSVTLRVFQRTRTPVLSYHLSELKPADDQTEAARSASRIVPQLVRPDEPIVVPLDGSTFAEQALPVAESLARAFGSYVVLVQAISPTDTSVADAESVDALHVHVVKEREVRDYLARVRAEVETQGVAATTCVEDGTPIVVIERVWREQGAGLIVMASHGSDGHHGTLIGSVAASILEELEAPVLVIQHAGVPIDQVGSAVQAATSPQNTTLDAQ